MVKMVQFLLSVDNIFLQEWHPVPKSPLLDFFRYRYAPTSRLIVFAMILIYQILPLSLASQCYKYNLHCGLSSQLTKHFKWFGTGTKKKAIVTHQGHLKILAISSQAWSFLFFWKWSLWDLSYRNCLSLTRSINISFIVASASFLYLYALSQPCLFRFNPFDTKGYA